MPVMTHAFAKHQPSRKANSFQKKPKKEKPTEVDFSQEYCIYILMQKFCVLLQQWFHLQEQALVPQCQEQCLS